MLRSAPAPRGGEHSIVVASDGVIEVEIRGVWSIAEVDRFFLELAPLHAGVRRQWARVLILILIGSVQPPAVALHVRDLALRIKQPGDRTAAVVATFLSKLQLKRLSSGDTFGLFTDAATARAWLLRD